MVNNRPIVYEPTVRRRVKTIAQVHDQSDEISRNKTTVTVGQVFEDGLCFITFTTLSATSMQNIELFELYSGKILGTLFTRFPLYTEIKVENIVTGVERDSLSEKEAHEIAGYTIKWLQRAGYIDPATADQMGSFRGTLTSKGFVCLTALPTSLEPKSQGDENLHDKVQETIGAQLAKSVEDGAKDYVKDSSKKVIKWLVTKAFAAGLLFISSAN